VSLIRPAVVAALCLAVVVPTGLGSQGEGDAAAVRALLARYYTCYAARDFEGFSRLWSRGAPDAGTLGEVASRFRSQGPAFDNIRLSGFRADGSEAGARVTVDLTITRPGGRQERATWIRSFRFRREGEEWRIASDVSVFEELVAKIRRQPSYEARLAVLDAEPDLLNEDLRRALGSQVNEAVRRGDTRSAIEFLRLSVAVAERNGNRSGAAVSWNDLALQYRLAGDTAAALDSHARALEIQRALGDAAGMARTEQAAAGVHYQSGEYEPASAAYERALKLFEVAGDRGSVASVLHALGNVAYVQGDYFLALERYERGLPLQQEAAAAAGAPHLAARGIAGGYHAIGMVHRELGDYQAALAALDKALALFTASADTAGEQNVREEMGAVHRARGDHLRALEQYVTSLRACQSATGPARNRSQEAALLAKIGEVYAIEAQYDAAIPPFEQSLKIFEELKAGSSMAAVLNGIGGVHRLQGQVPQALEDYRRSLELSEAGKDRRAMAATLALVGLAQADQERHEQALESYRKSADMARLASDSRALVRATVLAGGALAALGRHTEALDEATRGATQARELDDLDAFIHARLVAGEAHRQQRQPDAARKDITDAIDGMERLQARADDDPGGRFFGDRLGPYLAMVHLAMELGRQDEAFLALERAHLVRLRGLLDDGWLVTRGLTPEERAEERSLRGRTASLAIQLARARAQPRPAADRVAKLTAAVADTRKALDALEARLEATHPDLARLRAATNPLGVEDGAARLLDGRTALLEYAVTEAKAYVFVAARGEPGARNPSAPVGVRVYPIEATPRLLRSRVSRFRQLVQSQSEDVVSAGRELYDLLVRPAEADLAGIRELLIVPDGPLWNLPFHALPDAGAASCWSTEPWRTPSRCRRSLRGTQPGRGPRGLPPSWPWASTNGPPPRPRVSGC